MPFLRPLALPRGAALGAVGIGLLFLIRMRVYQASRRSCRSPDATVSPRRDRAVVGFRRSRLLRAFFRAPVGIYRLGLGGVLGNRFLLLTHRGRKSGRIYQTVLEVVHYDPATQESVVVSG